VHGTTCHGAFEHTHHSGNAHSRHLLIIEINASDKWHSTMLMTLGPARTQHQHQHQHQHQYQHQHNAWCLRLRHCLQLKCFLSNYNSN
jgi:hypothetical protein